MSDLLIITIPDNLSAKEIARQTLEAADVTFDLLSTVFASQMGAIATLDVNVRASIGRAKDEIRGLRHQLLEANGDKW